MEKEFNILIVSSYKNFFIKIKPYLSGFGAADILTAPSISEAQKLLMTKNISAIIINTPLSDGLGLDFATECAVKKFYAVLLFAKQELFGQITEKAAPHGILTLPEGTDAATLSEAFSVLMSTAIKLMKLDKTKEKELSRAEALKISSRAKLILISSFGMSEEQAHKYIERRAMEMRKTKNEIALSIINSYG
jgi:response regulator NasT